MPNQPQATSARRTAGTFAPRTPKEARTNTGNGIPYRAPAWALSNIGMSTIMLPSRIVPTAGNESRGQHVGRDADAHRHPQRGVVVQGPGAALDRNRRQVFVIKRTVVN